MIKELAPNNQSILYGYNDLFLNITTLYENNKLPNKILFSGLKGIGKATFSYHFINYVFSKDEQYSYDIKNFQINDYNRSFNLVKKNSHPNFYLINVSSEKKVIEIDQIREMINYSNKSTFNNKEKIILIDNADKLNKSSSNALLKIIEEPNDNIFFILISDNSKKILDTIKSRCIKFNFFLESEKSIEITNRIINDQIENFINIELINHYNTVSDFINLIKFSDSENLDISKITLKDFLTILIDNKFYKKNIYIKENISKYIEAYMLKLFRQNNFNKKISSLYDIITKKKFYYQKFNLDEESFFIELKSKVLNG